MTSYCSTYPDVLYTSKDKQVVLSFKYKYNEVPPRFGGNYIKLVFVGGYNSIYGMHLILSKLKRKGILVEDNRNCALVV